MKTVQTTYRAEDVTLLLKDISGMIDPLPAEEREKFIRSGTHYCEMLPLEYRPSEDYLKQYRYALDNFSGHTAKAVSVLAEMIYRVKKQPVLVSLARAGLPAGILIKRYLERKYGISVPHFGISIIRGRGIDKNAMKYILGSFAPERIQFVDGWTGKGAIQRQLAEALSPEEYEGVDKRLAVLADPANVTALCGTHDDFLIASSCLNSTVSGLVSRTVLRDDLIGENDFHGAVYYGGLLEEDRSYEFIDRVEREMTYGSAEVPSESIGDVSGYEEAEDIGRALGIDDINLIKPGIGETTRVLLRRMPYRILIARDCPEIYISHILALAREKNVPAEEYPLKNYRSCGIIKNTPSDA